MLSSTLLRRLRWLMCSWVHTGRVASARNTLTHGSEQFTIHGTDSTKLSSRGSVGPTDNLSIYPSLPLSINTQTSSIKLWPNQPLRKVILSLTLEIRVHRGVALASFPGNCPALFSLLTVLVGEPGNEASVAQGSGTNQARCPDLARLALFPGPRPFRLQFSVLQVI